MAFETQQPILVLIGLIIGALIGELFQLDRHMNSGADRLKSTLKSTNEKFAQGFVTSSLLFCVGAMSTLGPIEEGLGNTPTTLYTKSVMDGFSSIALASAFGLGVMFSAVPTLLYQGSLALLAVWIAPYVSEELVGEITAVGGLMIVGIALNMLEVTKIKVINMLPALAVVPIILYLKPHILHLLNL